jgi:pimeloyl-[acyl-carrier protein] methyl ester esterase
LRSLRHDLAQRPAPNPAALALGLDLLRDEDLRGPLPDLRPPSLWLFGSHDALVPAEVADRIALLLPQARTHVIPGAAHAPFLSHPEQTADSIRAFLAGLDP